MGGKGEGDRTTLSWAHAMHHRREVVVRTSSDVAAGTVNELTLTHVRIGNKRIERRKILTVRVLARAARQRLH